jgi:hypothetical protein
MTTKKDILVIIEEDYQSTYHRLAREFQRIIRKEDADAQAKNGKEIKKIQEKYTKITKTAREAGAEQEIKLLKNGGVELCSGYGIRNEREFYAYRLIGTRESLDDVTSGKELIDRTESKSNLKTTEELKDKYTKLRRQIMLDGVDDATRALLKEFTAFCEGAVK